MTQTTTPSTATSTASTQPETFDGPSHVSDGQILARGVPIADLIGTVSYIDMLFFQIQARYPTDTQRTMMDAYLTSLCEHGVTSPSTHGPRVTSSVRAPLASSAISFIATAMGPYHFGALEHAMQEIQELNASDESTRAFLDRKSIEGRPIWGFGHRFHKSTDEHDADQEGADPRVKRLIELADELGWDGPHLRRVRQIGQELYARKRIPINIDGIAAGLLLDMGFDPQAALLFVIIGRLPNITRLHCQEQTQPPNRFTGIATRNDPGFDRTVIRDNDVR